jgi:hypothetical protein
VAQQQINKVQWNPQGGGLNSDLDPKGISGGDLLVTGVNSGGMNIRNVGKGLNVVPDYEPIYGNDFVYSLDPAVAQNKKWRIYVDSSETSPLVSQPNVVLNGNFVANITNWTSAIPGAWVWNAGGYAEHIPGVGNQSLFFQTQTGIDPGFYTVQFDVVSCTSGSIWFPGNQFSNTIYTSNGTYTAEFPVVVDTSGNFGVYFFADDNFDGGIDNIIIRKVAEVYAFEPFLADAAGNQINFTFPFYWPVFNNIQDSLDAISNWLLYTSDAISGLSPSSTTVITGSYTGYVEFELIPYPYSNYIFREDYVASLSNVSDCVNVIVSQEAIDPGSLGEWNLIGSDDRPGYSFQFWTTRDSLPSNLEIQNVSDNGSGVIRITTVEPHDLIPNQSVRISLVEGAVEANGIWIVNVIDQFNFDLYGSTYSSLYVSGGIITYDIYGLGEIGVAVRGDDGIVTYTRLLRSIELNFTTLKQIDVRVKRKQDSRFAAYFTDNYNVPRVFYYKGSFIQDGALNFINSDNIYEYVNISSELRWLVNNEDFYIDVIGQNDSGGTLKSGNWRYSARLLTSNFTATNWSQLTEGIPVFVDSNTDIHLIGSNADVPTSKLNRLKLTNNVSGLYTYVEIAALNYINNIAPYGYIIGRFVLSDDDVQYFNHSGQEPEQLDLDPGTLNDFSNAFVLAQNVELLDNRAILSNLTPAQTFDFTQWVETFKYSLNRKILDPVGVWSTNSLQVGEYQEPMNVYSYKSHMMMETYRYGFRFKLKNGSLTQAFYPGYDIKIDLPTTLPIERIAGTFTSFDLTDQAGTPSGGPTEVYSIYISWENINLSFLIDGTPAYDLIDEIIPCRATVIPEVLVHGCGALGVSGGPGISFFYSTANTPPGKVSPYPFINGETSYGTSTDIYPGISGSSPYFSQERDSIYIYAPDLHFDLLDINFQPGDELFILGNPVRHDTYVLAYGIDGNYYAEFDGHTNITLNPSPYIFNSNPGSFLFNHPIYTPGTGQETTLGSTGYANYIFGSSLSTNTFWNEKSLVCNVTTPISNNSTNNDYGFYRVIYYRPLLNKYGDPLGTIYNEFLPPYKIGSNRTLIVSGDFNTYGDVFTQKSYLKYRYPGWWNGSQWYGWGSCTGYYTQNRNNVQLRCKIDESFDGKFIPTKDLGIWISRGYDNPGGAGFNAESKYLYVSPDGGGRDSQLFYNTGYTPVNNVTTVRSFNPLLEYQTDWGNAIAWSDPESEGSNTDNLRNFPPLNLKFLDYTQGPITDARNMNGELITIQHTEVQRQYFNTTAMQTTVGGGEVYLGTGAVLSRRGTTMNKFGSKHKWSIIMGLSDKGHDVLYGVDDVNNSVWRLGYDGTNNLDEVQGMKAFFSNNLQWIRGKYTPAHDEGIRGVANHRYREVIWTLRGRKQFPEWQEEDNQYYSFNFNSSLGNDLVYNGNLASSGTLDGWESLDVTFPYATNIAWNLQYNFTLLSYVAETAGSGLAGLLGQTTPIPFVAGNTYLITVNVPIAPTGVLGVVFQLGGPYTAIAAGVNSFNYVAQPGDNNIYIYAAAGANGYVSSVSVKEVLNTNANWTGYPDWVLSNNEACTNPPLTFIIAPLIQNVPNYTTAGLTWNVEFEVSDYVGGDLSVTIGDVTTLPLGISGVGQYTATATPTVAGVVKLNPDPGFEGCIKGNVKVYTTSAVVVYNEGDIVQTSGYGSIMSTWSQTPDIWICLKDNVTSNPYTPPVDPNDPDWELIPHTNPNYYTEYTIIYNELKNKFQTFMSILPKIYAHFQNGYLVPRPISNTGRVYQSDTGIPTYWFAEGIDAQSEDAFIDPVINTPPGRKRFLAVRVESDVAPTSMTVSTNTGSSVTGGAEFEQREGNEFDGYVKDTPADSIIQGDYAVFRFTIAATTYNKINSFIASVRERARKWFK